MPPARKSKESEQSWALSAPFRPDGGAAWIADLPPELWPETDNNEAPYRSWLRLLEDDRELGPAHAIHVKIQEAGDGRYSFWIDVVYFSTSDGSDPNGNGRTYSVVRAPSRSDPATVLRGIAPARYGSKWTAPERAVRCAVLGIGNRGRALARLLAGFEGVEIAWLVDVSPDRMAQLALPVAASTVRTTADFAEALADPGVDLALVTLPDHLHRAAAEQAFRAGKHVYLEKPIATRVEDAKAILRAWKQSGRVLQIGYVLRAAPFYQAIRNVVRQGRLGPVRVISLSEQLSVVHGASFMRRWHAESAHSGGLIVHKSSHDLDLACWLLDSRPRFVGSFGGLSTFRKPAPAPFCSQCGERGQCPYVDAGLYENRTAAEWANPTAYGLDRCVFGMKKDVIDNQVVSFEMESGVHGTYYLAMQGPHRSERRITLIGDLARLDGVFEDGRFTITYTEPEREALNWSTDSGAQSGHGGGDRSTVTTLLNACVGRAPPPIKNVSSALAGLVFAVAAERARTARAVVTLRDQDFGLNRD
jgi:predicted dehydrogenase